MYNTFSPLLSLIDCRRSADSSGSRGSSEAEQTLLMYNALRGGRIERVYRLPHQYRPRWNIDGAILDHFISPSVLSSRARNSVARIYIPIDFRPHVETALSKKDRMRANKRRINIRSRSLLGTRREIDRAIVDFARSSELTKATNSKEKEFPPVEINRFVRNYPDIQFE